MADQNNQSPEDEIVIHRHAFSSDLSEEIDETVTVRTPYGICEHGFGYENTMRVCRHN